MLQTFIRSQLQFQMSVWLCFCLRDLRDTFIWIFVIHVLEYLHSSQIKGIFYETNNKFIKELTCLRDSVD